MGEMVKHLEAAKEIIINPDNWTKNSWARTKDGMIVLVEDERAFCFCQGGARALAASKRSKAEPMGTHKLLVEVLPQGFENPIVFNDDKSIEHSDVIVWLNNAIFLAKERNL